MEKYHQELGNEIIMNTHLVHRFVSTDNIQSDFLWLADGTEAELKTDLLIARFFLKCLVLSMLHRQVSTVSIFSF